MKGRSATLILSFLLFLLPFEPRRPAISAFGLTFTLLEAAAAAAMAALLAFRRERLAAVARRPPLPLTLLACYAGAQLLSASLAPACRGAAAVFALRMVACVILAALVAATPREAQASSLRALVAGTLLLAVLVVLDGAGAGRADPLLASFREPPAPGHAARRASGASEGPNLAATWLMQGLVTSAGLGASAPLFAVAPAWGLFALALQMTGSRAGVASAVAGLAVLALAGRRRGESPRAPLAAGVLAIAAWVLPGFLAPGRSAELGVVDARRQPAPYGLSLRPGGARRVTIRVNNAGSTTWPGGTRLRARWRGVPAGEEPLAAEAVLAAPVRPGAGAAPSMDLHVPKTPGVYRLRWELSAGGAEPLSLELPVHVEERAEAYVALQFWLPSAPRPRGRAELWRLAGAMWLRHPITGAGPDNFRRLHGAYGGFGAWNVVDSAHSLFLEVAATSGTLGLAALLATLIATARAAWRRAVPARAHGAPDAVCPALLAGLVAHGTVEFLLGFTGQYLLFGLLVGMVSSQGATPEVGSD